MDKKRLFGMLVPASALIFALSLGNPAMAKSKKKKHEEATTTTSQTTKPSHTARTTHARLTGYKTESEAKGACGMSGVVWHARGSKAFHGSKSRYFGKTKHGAYVCEKAAVANGLHAAKN